MQKYKDKAGASGVESFMIETDSITIRFKTGGIYLYNSFKPGCHHVKKMKRLALSGNGLATYINQHVRENYAAHLK